MVLSAAAKKKESNLDDLDPAKRGAREKIAELDRIIIFRNEMLKE